MPSPIFLLFKGRMTERDRQSWAGAGKVVERDLPSANSLSQKPAAAQTGSGQSQEIQTGLPRGPQEPKDLGSALAGNPIGRRGKAHAKSHCRGIWVSQLAPVSLKVSQFKKIYTAFIGSLEN